jgi:hypothetical protein
MMCASRYWELGLSGVKVGQKGVPPLNSSRVILDSGASLIFAGPQDADTINQVVPQSSPSLCSHATRITEHMFCNPGTLSCNGILEQHSFEAPVVVVLLVIVSSDPVLNQPPIDAKLKGYSVA